MRKTGVTTRLIDKAIQTLFKFGYVFFPSNKDDCNNKCAVCETVGTVMTSKYLMNKTKNRILNEHPEVNIYLGDNFIRINDN